MWKRLHSDGTKLRVHHQAISTHGRAALALIVVLDGQWRSGGHGKLETGFGQRRGCRCDQGRLGGPSACRGGADEHAGTMAMNDSNLVLVSALGAAQGLFLGALLIAQPYDQQPANRWLAAFILAFALLTVGDVLEKSGTILVMPHLAHWFDWLIFLLGPLYYQYQRCLIGDPPLSRWAFMLHALPALLLLVELLPFYGLSAAEKTAIIQADLELIRSGQTLYPILVLAALQILVYWIVCAFHLRRYAQRLEQHHSSIERLSFHWLKLLLQVNIGLWLIWIVMILTASPLAGMIDALGFPVVIYTLGYFGLRQPRIFAPTLFGESAATTTISNNPIAALSDSVKYAKSGLNEDRAALYLSRLNELMDTEKPWLENELTLPELADRLNMSPQHLSQILNDRLSQTFFEFINRRRVEEVKRCLSDPTYEGESIMAIALAAGFSSKAAFNTAFKRYTELTPSQYRRQHLPAKS